MSEPMESLDQDSEDELDLPSLSLIFSVSDETADWDVLLSLSNKAIDAIEAADPRFSILKAFTYYAGEAHESDRRRIEQVRELLKDTAGMSARMLARDILEIVGEAT